MNARGLLDADMSTVGRWVGQGFNWWLGELGSLFSSFGSPRDTGGPAALLNEDGNLVVVRAGLAEGLLAPGRTTRLMTMLIDRSECLIRTVDLPVMSQGDLRRMLFVEADRLMPSPAGGMLIAAELPEATFEAGRMRVAIAGLPRATALRLLDACRVVDVWPKRVAVTDPRDPQAREFDFLPAMREAGLLGSDRSARGFWWAVVAFLFLVNIAALVWRDMAATDALEQLVEAQQPSVAIAQRIRSRLSDVDRVAAQATRRRERGDALRAMAAVSAQLPPGSWVQNFSWSGDTVKIAGYKRRGIDVVAALRRSPMLIDVRPASGDQVSDIPGGQPFQISARLRGR